MKKRKVIQQYKDRALRNLEMIRGGADDGPIDKDKVKRVNRK